MELLESDGARPRQVRHRLCFVVDSCRDLRPDMLEAAKHPIVGSQERSAFQISPHKTRLCPLNGREVGNLDVCDSRLDKAGKAEIRSWRVPGCRADCRSLRSPRAGRFPFSISFQLRRSENRKNAANPAFFELDCKLPKLRTWVRFPSPAPE